MTLIDAKRITGGLSFPSKMPCPAYSLPAYECKTGSILRTIPNSTCSACYALKGHYRFRNVRNATERRLAAIRSADWVDAMVLLIRNYVYFRWHDSGDIQDLEHLIKICDVARRTPDTKHWLPTRERSIVNTYLAQHTVPDNLIIRISATLIDNEPPDTPLPTSTVHHTSDPVGHACPARQQNNECGLCRACWNPAIANVSYQKH